MYYETKIINGKLYQRGSPRGEWILAENKLSEIVDALMQITEDQRMQVFSLFCKHCGSDDPYCQCWNDE